MIDEKDDTDEEEIESISTEELIAKLDEKYLSLRMQTELFKDRMRKMKLELEGMNKAIQAESSMFRQEKDKYIRLLPLNNDLRRVIEDNNSIVATVLGISQDMSNEIHNRAKDIFELIETIEQVEKFQEPVLEALSTEIDSLRERLEISNALARDFFSLDEKSRKRIRKEIIDPPDIFQVGNAPVGVQEEKDEEKKEISDIVNDVNEVEEDYLKELGELLNQG